VSGFVPFRFYSATVNSQGGCEGSSSFMVYGAYGGLFALSTLVEALIQARLGKAFKQGRRTASAPSCSRFVFTAWL
jgi:hypothetical protein